MIEKRFVMILVLLCIFELSGQTVKISDFGFDAFDSTKYIYDAILSENVTIIFDKQRTQWITGPLLFNQLKNKVLVFEEGVLLCAKEGGFVKTTDALMEFRNSHNIIIIGNSAILQMNKKEYTDGEWRHCISLRSCTSINIYNLTLKDSGGDGIYIAGSKKGEFSENIQIENIVSDNNKRQGMSIVSAKNVTVKNSIFKNTKGTLPEAGVDVEPNSKLDRIQGIRFYDCTFVENNHAGVVLALHNLESDSAPVDIEFVNCVVENNHDKGNKYIASELIFNAHKTNPVKGKVVFENCLIKNSKWGLFYSRKTVDAYNVTFKNCSALNICKDGSYPPIYLEVPDYYKGSYQLGGYIFDNLTLQYNANVPYMSIRGSTLPTLKNVSSISGDITLISTQEPKVEYIKYSGSNNIDVDINITQE